MKEKEIYESPSIKIFSIAHLDIITASGGDMTDEDGEFKEIW